MNNEKNTGRGGDSGGGGEMIGQVRKSLEAGLYPLLRKADVDRPVFYGVMARAWTVISGPVTALLIATKFSPEVQGYYYTFLNLLALQIFIELGFGIVIIQFASHEWSKLGLNREGEIEGDPESLS